ncbi:type IV pilus assembly protein PilE [Oxalobacteraceae bacterium GrIS 1.11]
MKRGENGFTLIEMMVTVAIIGILTSIALPNYTAYVTRTRLTDAFTALGATQPSAEQYWANGRTYANFAVINGLPANTPNFTFALAPGASATAYTVTATGIGKMVGFNYSIDQAGAHVTTALPGGWTLPSPSTCWTDRKDGTCSQ